MFNYLLIILIIYVEFIPFTLTNGDRGNTVVKVLCYKAAGSIPAGVSEFFIDIKSFR